MIKRPLTLSVLAVFALLAAPPAHAAYAGAAPTQMMQAKNVIGVPSNSQATIDDRIRIAAYNFREETYKDALGAERHGLTAALQVFEKGAPGRDQKLRVHPGSKFSAGAKSFEVIAVDKSGVQIAIK